MEKNKKIILIILIALVVVSTGAVFWVKLKDLGYLGKKNNKSVDLVNIGELRDFQGIIISTDLEKKSILVKGVDMSQIAKNADSSEFEFFLASDSQIILKEWKGTKEISLADLRAREFVSINAQEKTGGVLTAKKVVAANINFMVGKVSEMENEKITVIEEKGINGGDDEVYTAILDENTKIIIRDNREIFSKGKDKPDLSKVSEKAGTISDIQVGSFVVITPQTEFMLQGEREFVSVNIKIILN